MQTIGPFPAFPLNAAASGNAPAPSEMTRAFSAINRIAFLVSSRLTTNEPSTTGFIRSHMRGNTLWPPAPSTNDLSHSLNSCRRPRREGKRKRRGRLRFHAPNFDLRSKRLDRAAHAGDESAAADARDDRDGVGRVFQNLEAHRPMAGDEIVIVERDE